MSQKGTFDEAQKRNPLPIPSPRSNSLHLYVGKPITQVISIDRGAFFLLHAQNRVMTALNAVTSKQRWQVAPGSGDGFQVIIQPTLIWIINQDTGNITAFDFNGKMRWSLDGPSSPNEAVIA